MRPAAMGASFNCAELSTAARVPLGFAQTDHGDDVCDHVAASSATGIAAHEGGASLRWMRLGMARDLGVVLLFLTTSCGHAQRTVPLTGSSIVPEATGVVTLRDTDKVNKTLEVRVRNLARPESLPGEALGSAGTTPAQTYVVWVQPIGSSPPENVGALVPDKQLDADLVTKTAQSKFDVFITAEPGPTQTMPTGRRLLQATVGP